MKKKKEEGDLMRHLTTSSLQQDAGNKLNFATKKTMMIAQQLYEGISIKGKGVKIGRAHV